MTNTFEHLMKRFRMMDVRPYARRQLPAEIVSQYESALGHRIPSNIIEFIEEYGFKMFDIAKEGDVLFSTHNYPKIDYGGVGVFFGIAGTTGDDYDILWQVERIRSRASEVQRNAEGCFCPSGNGQRLDIRDYLPFASCAGMPLVLGLGGAAKGAVFLLDLETWQMEHVSRSFLEFLESLHVKPA